MQDTGEVCPLWDLLTIMVTHKRLMEHLFKALSMPGIRSEPKVSRWISRKEFEKLFKHFR